MAGVISVRVTEAEQDILNQVSAMYGCGVSSLMKRLAFERLEDEYDMQTIHEYEHAKVSGTLKTRPIEKLWAELEL